jgi:ribosomal-protein-alanine N-acetyltransferase
VPDTLRDAELVGMPVSASDLPYLALIFGDVEVGKTLGGIRSDDEIVAIYSHWRDLWAELQYGPFLFRTTADEFVGYSGVRPAPIGEPDDIELLYAILPDFWGRGVATRISRLVVDWAFVGQGFDSLVAFTLTTNNASMSVMQKLGFRYERDIEKAGLPHVFYRLARESWALRTRADDSLG